MSLFNNNIPASSLFIIPALVRNCHDNYDHVNHLNLSVHIYVLTQPSDPKSSFATRKGKLFFILGLIKQNCQSETPVPVRPAGDLPCHPSAFPNADWSAFC